MKDAFVGIDVACAKRKYLPIVVTTMEDRCLLPLPLRSSLCRPPRGAGNVATLDPELVREFSVAARDYLVSLEKEFGLRIRRVAIDAPRTYRLEQQTRRACEQALDARKISCFTTPSRAEFVAIRAKVRQHLAQGGAEARLPHANQLWMLVGFSIFDALGERFECLEVYPQAIIKCLGVQAAHKSKPKGLMAQMECITAKTGWPTPDGDLGKICFGYKHDKLDAYLSAWIASLDEDQREAIGDLPDDVIWLPRM